MIEKHKYVNKIHRTQGYLMNTMSMISLGSYHKNEKY